MKIIETPFHPIFIGKDLDQNVASFAESISPEAVIITDSNLKKLYGLPLKEKLETPHIFDFPAGEKSKNRKTKEDLEDKLLDLGLSRDALVIALGGGVVTDLVGFLASTYLRGICLINMPTSLVGMVDASIGGKTGVNTSKGKNLIGSFYHPKGIFIDLNKLKTLDEKQFQEGMVEVIKYALIKDHSFFTWLKKHEKERSKLSFLEEMVTKCVAMKCYVVERDQKETKGLRMILNFGHTVGHALEKLSKFTMTHGEAVAVGILVESYLSKEMGLLKEEDIEKIQEIFSCYQIPCTMKLSFSFKEFYEVMTRDKKAKSKTPRFVLLEGIGKVHQKDHLYAHAVPLDLLEKAYNWMMEL